MCTSIGQTELNIPPIGNSCGDVVLLIARFGATAKGAYHEAVPLGFDLQVKFRNAARGVNSKAGRTIKEAVKPNVSDGEVIMTW